MLDKIIFIQCLNFIKNCYVNWQLELGNEQVIETWYDFFQNIDTNDFIKLVKDYCKEKEFAPQSPASLLNFLESQFIKQELDVFEAWEKITSLIREIGFQRQEDKKTVYLELNDFPVLKKTTWQLERELSNLKVDDYYLQKIFKEAYLNNVCKSVKIKMQDNLSLTFSQKALDFKKGGKK